jgi:arylsulfatase A-like enzyme
VTPTRRELLQAGLLSPSLAPWLARARRAPDRPNLLFLHTDQQTFDTLSALGCTLASTPALDRLARRGTAFRLSYSADPVCMPARAAWYTGRPSSESGVFRNGAPLLASIPDLGTLLGKAGYDTVYSGKWHVPGRPLEQSFRVLAGKTIYGEFGDRPAAQAAAAFLRETRATPFFLSVGLLQPHDINFWVEAYGRQDCPLLPLPEAELPPLPGNFVVEFEEPEAYRLRRAMKGARSTESWKPLHWQSFLWTYHRFIEMVDAQIGHVLDALEASAHAENTLVIFSSDHGESLGHHGLVSKSVLYESSVRVPLLVSWPGHVPAGRVDESHLISGLDLAPTLCDYAGIDPPPSARGLSLRPLLEPERNDAVPWRSYLVSESNAQGRMVRSARYKWIVYTGDPVELFFDLEQDPLETRNLARVEPHRVALEAHRAFLAEREAGLIRAPASGVGSDEDE